MKLDFTKTESPDIINKLKTKYNFNEHYMSSIKIISDDIYDILVFNLNIFFKDRSFTASDIIKSVLKIEKTGFSYHCQVNHYLYFLRKKSLFHRLFKKS